MTDEFFERVGTSPRRNAIAAQWQHRSLDSGVPPLPVPEPEQMSGIISGQRRWAANQDTFYGAAQTYDELPAGLYRCSVHPNLGPILLKQSVETDNLLELPDDAARSIIGEFEQFWKIAPSFVERGFLHKRGFLLWGPPGSGKTSAVHLLVQRLIRDYDGIVLLLDHPQIAAHGLQMIRNIEPKRPMIAIMEDLDALIQKFGENEYLALLDGEAQVDNIVFVATTNYPEMLDRRFVDRPSRFDTVRYIGMPSAAAREMYLSSKEPSLDGDELALWVKRSDGFSVAHLKEMIVAIRCFKQPLESVVERLEQMQARKPTSEDSPDRMPIGFAA